MKILLVTSELPYPPASGGAIRVYGIARGLHANGHKVFLAAFGLGQVPPQLTEIAEVSIVPPPTRSKIARLRQLITTSKSDIQTRLWSNAMLNHLLDLHETHHFDVIQFEGIEMGGYLPALRAAYPNLSLVFDTFNAEATMQATIARIDAGNPHRWLQAIYSWMQTRRLTHYEGELCRAADLVLAVSDEDAELLNRYQPRRSVVIVPSGITVADYPTRTIQQEARTLVFTGKMDYRPNVDAMVWFVRDVLPMIPNAKLLIVGQKPTSAISALAKEGRVEVTGRVDSVIPYLHHSTVYIAPLRMGSGTRLKILEALACECAIVATPLAASGLNLDVKNIMVVAEDANAFAASVNQLLDDADARMAMQQQARHAIETHYDWSVIIPRLLTALESVTHG